MAMPQRDNWIDALRRTDILLEHAVKERDEEEIARLRAKLDRIIEKI